MEIEDHSVGNAPQKITFTAGSRASTGKIGETILCNFPGSEDLEIVIGTMRLFSSSSVSILFWELLRNSMPLVAGYFLSLIRLLRMAIGIALTSCKKPLWFLRLTGTLAILLTGLTAWKLATIERQQLISSKKFLNLLYWFCQMHFELIGLPFFSRVKLVQHFSARTVCCKHLH